MAFVTVVNIRRSISQHSWAVIWVNSKAKANQLSRGLCWPVWKSQWMFRPGYRCHDPDCATHYGSDWVTDAMAHAGLQLPWSRLGYKCLDSGLVTDALMQAVLTDAMVQIWFTDAMVQGLQTWLQMPWSRLGYNCHGSDWITDAMVQAGLQMPWSQLGYRCHNIFVVFPCMLDWQTNFIFMLHLPITDLLVSLLLLYSHGYLLVYMTCFQALRSTSTELSYREVLCW